MNIGNKYSDNKMYRGVRYYEKVPLFGYDLNEASDIQSSKLAKIMDNLFVSGILNNVEPSYSNDTINLNSPVVLNIKGDICIVKNSDDVSLVSGISDNIGTVHIVGWYQHIISSTRMTEYGGVDNAEIENDLAANEFNIQSTSRYQFRWCTYVSRDPIPNNATITIPLRDSNGLITGNSVNIHVREQLGNLQLADKPAEMDYVEDDIYIIPIMSFQGTSGVLTSVTPVPKISMSFNYRLMDIRLEHIISSEISTASDITFTLGVDRLLEEDILRVTYEGIELSESVDYSINRSDRSLTLIGFTCRPGERVKVNITRLVEY